MSITNENINKIDTRMLADYDNVTPGTVYAEGLRLDLPDSWRSPCGGWLVG